MNDVEYWIWLQHAVGCGEAFPRRMLGELGSAQAIFASPAGSLNKYGLGPAQRRRFEDRSLGYAQSVTAACLDKGIGILTFGDSGYPERLRQIYSPPCVLYYRGRVECLADMPAIAMVGTRRITPYGMEAATKLAMGLASHGALVVSGLAVGVDTAAHKGALKASGMTAAVIGCGPDIDYPASNRELRRLIEAHGVVVSEYPPGVRPSAFTFPIRNRIIAGLSLGTVVVEAGARSGSLITSGLAAEMGRDVFAVPGSIFSPMSEGTNRLLRDGAKPVACAADILDEYTGLFPLLAAGNVSEQLSFGMAATAAQAAPSPAAPAPARAKKPQGLTPVQSQVLCMLGAEPEHVDSLALRANLEPRAVLGALTALEIMGLARSFPGRRFSAM